METIVNPQLQLASEFVQFTGLNIFLTGKAGTGKTTFLHNLKTQSPKRMIVVAPTGVAAINAGGVTIHSFFQMPFGPHIPMDGTTVERNSPQGFHKFNREKIKIIKSLDLLVIDEISMVRADLLDGIDEVLRKYKDRYKPFGGVQLLMIGDLQQLAPVIKDDEWEILKKYYETGFFFSSRALQKTETVSIELKHIYRQSDQTFINLLNKVRENNLDKETLTALNERYIPGAAHENNEGYITLTTHNAQAQELNEFKINKLPPKPRTFTASVQGEFPEYSYPTDSNLTLKKDAQVMFVKNDSSREKLYYNGKIGKITRLEEETIYVKCQGDEDEIAVQKAEWQNLKYSIDEQSKEIREDIAGTFVQYPLKLAWAITIHKSQGLTFEKAIIDANAAFAHGQVYVALSRCKTLEGIILSTPISVKSIKSDSTVAAFSRDVEQNSPTPEFLSESKHAYQLTLLTELIDFNPIRRKLNYCVKLLNEHRSSIHLSFIDRFNRMEAMFTKDMAEVSDKFRVQVHGLIGGQKNIRENALLQERISKGCVYFAEKLETFIILEIQNNPVDIDNRAIRKPVNEAIARLQEDALIKQACLNACRNGFSVKDYMKAKAKALFIEPQSQAGKKNTGQKNQPVPGKTALYHRLKAWRDEKAEESDLPGYMVLPQKTIMELASAMPVSTENLLKIRGFGSKKIKAFGKEIIQIIVEYCEVNNINTYHNQPKPSDNTEKPPKKSTRQITLDLFKAGKQIAEIASDRGLSTTTIEEHLAHFVGTGELDIHPFVPAEKLSLITDYFTRNDSTRLGPAKLALGDNITWGELKFAVKYLDLASKKEL